MITNEKNNRYFSALFHMVRRPRNPIDMVLNIKFALKRVPSGMASTPAVTVFYFASPFDFRSVVLATKLGRKELFEK